MAVARAYPHPFTNTTLTISALLCAFSLPATRLRWVSAVRGLMPMRRATSSRVCTLGLV